MSYCQGTHDGSRCSKTGRGKAGKGKGKSSSSSSDGRDGKGKTGKRGKNPEALEDAPKARPPTWEPPPKKGIGKGSNAIELNETSNRGPPLLKAAEASSSSSKEPANQRHRASLIVAASSTCSLAGKDLVPLGRLQPLGSSESRPQESASRRNSKVAKRSSDQRVLP